MLIPRPRPTGISTDLGIDAAHAALKDGNDGFGYALSAEAGQRIALMNGGRSPRQAQLLWSSVRFDSFTDAYGARISSRDGDSLTGRVGLAANYASSWQGEDGLKVNTDFYGIVNLYQELMGENRLNYAGTHLASETDKTWGGIGAGGVYAWADNKYSVYGEALVNTALNNPGDSYSVRGTAGFKAKW
ncbi:autotransporter outer membrane beta-barrel domain-containing protein [Brucella pituitosa]|uniref:autotransporter outer membrane beta-barrel domain-containing protein n=1 Tax=Brucella pituitosa TaxID=571256 RepID=UPI002494BE96|nr:autotransporter outer membrane beta-barrel domain-containing protein [Brucella pituitosa]